MASAPAEAGLMGATVNVSAYFPSTGTVFEDPGDVVVSGALEYPQGSFASYSAGIQVDISDNQLIFDDTLENVLPASEADFNGFILRVLSGPAIATASVDPASAYSPVELTVENGALLANYQGLKSKDFPGRFSIINFTTVPEPASALLVALGLAGLAFRRARRG